MKESFFAQKAFITHDGKLLAIRKSDNDPNQPGKWEVPGGRMKFGEDIDEHISREVKEEVGIDVLPGKPFYVWQWQISRLDGAGNKREIQIVAVARQCVATDTNLSTKCQESDDYIGELKWVPIEKLSNYDWIDNMLPVIRAYASLMESN